MIFRLSQKLAKKLKEGTLPSLPLDENPYADWSAHLFTADRTQYIILMNTKSLYSVVTYGKGITDDSRFIERALSCIREFMEDDGQEFVYRRFIAPASGIIRFGKALNRSVTGSMNDLVYHAKMWLTEGGLSPYDTGFHLNEIPMSPLGYQNPREAFRKLAGGLESSERGDVSRPSPPSSDHRVRERQAHDKGSHTLMQSDSRTELTELEQLPNVGPAIASDLRLIGVTSPQDLLGKDPYTMYDDLCQTTRVRHDPCELDVFISAVRFMAGEPKKPWWKYTLERKRQLAARSENQENSAPT